MSLLEGIGKCLVIEGSTTEKIFEGYVDSKIKGILREADARTREALLEAVSEALSMVTAEDARGFFGDCGYHLVAQYL